MVLVFETIKIVPIPIRRFACYYIVLRLLPSCFTIYHIQRRSRKKKKINLLDQSEEVQQRWRKAVKDDSVANFSENSIQHRRLICRIDFAPTGTRGVGDRRGSSLLQHALQRTAAGQSSTRSRDGCRRHKVNNKSRDVLIRFRFVSFFFSPSLYNPIKPAFSRLYET